VQRRAGLRVGNGVDVGSGREEELDERRVVRGGL